MNIIQAWRRGYTGNGVVVTILDDGIEYTHDDLKDNYVKSCYSCIYFRQHLKEMIYQNCDVQIPENLYVSAD